LVAPRLRRAAPISKVLNPLRIHVTGNAGSGKTTLGNRIGAEFDLPVFGLDQIVWQSGWTKTDPATRDRLEEELIEKPDWVIEGVSHLIRRAADVTIFLDVPLQRCTFRALKRSVPFLFKGRPELPPDCPEYKIIPKLFGIIWGFSERVKPIILNDMAGGYRIIRLEDPDLFDSDELRRRLTGGSSVRRTP